jgi:hypothetical protein
MTFTNFLMFLAKGSHGLWSLGNRASAAPAFSPDEAVRRQPLRAHRFLNPPGGGVAKFAKRRVRDAID